MIQFSKMHGLGNDFVVVNAISQSISVETLPILQLGNRHLGIGFDQLLLIEKSTQANFSCRIFNADGSEAEQCGNGMRCIARFIRENNLIQQKSFSIETKAGVIPVTVNEINNVTVNMGLPRIESACDISLFKDQPHFTLSNISMGNPHAILVVPSIQDFPVADIGTRLSTHSFFPYGTNVGFMEIINSHRICLRTVERGAGETFACGSNACAAVVAGIEKQLLNEKVQVSLPLGDLWIEWGGTGTPVFMTGPAEHVFDGTIVLR